MRPAALLLLPSLLALLAHGKGPRRPATGTGRARTPRGRKAGPSQRLAPRVLLSLPSTASRRLLFPAPTQPGGARAPAAGSCRGSRHSLPAETSPLIISLDLMGFLCCNSSRHPLPAHTRSPARYLAPLQASRGAGARCGGAGDRGCRVRTVQLAARRSASPAVLQTSLDFAAESGAPRILTAEEPGRVVAGPGIGTSLTSLRLGTVMSELEPRAQFWGDIRGPWEPSVRRLALR